VTAVFAKIAYLHIPDFELQQHDEAKVIPCVTYQDLFRKRMQLDVPGFLTEADYGNSFTITTDNVIAVTVLAQDVIIVALRGTRLLKASDWWTDLRATRTRVHVGGRAYRFHSGFFGATEGMRTALAQSIAERMVDFGRPPPVYVVGHSLGGALAAVTLALDGVPTSDGASPRPLPVHSAYTFGMPRYGNADVVNRLRNPAHCYHLTDIVPTLPPRWLGFADVPLEYAVGCHGMDRALPRHGSWPRSSLQRLHLARGVRHHFIERYIKDLAVGANVR
jgi:hypothetical protein